MSNSFFSSLNYTCTNEDSLLEYYILPVNSSHVISIAGSGSRVIPLLAKYPKQITCVDTSQAQLYITELRIEALRALHYSEYLYFWGYPQEQHPNFSRKELFQKISLADPTYHYLQELFEKNNWEGLLYEGKWEKTFKKLSYINRLIIGKHGTNIFQISEPNHYYKYLKKTFPHLRWKLVVTLLGNASLFNTLLYKGSFPQKNIALSFSDFYMNAFDNLFHQGPVSQNYFLQIIFFGKIIVTTGLPAECDPNIYNTAKEALNSTKISYYQGDIFKYISTSTTPIDFISLSDVPSYLKDTQEQSFLQDIKPKLSPGAVIVARYYLHIPERVDDHGFKKITDQFNSQINTEKVQMYKIEVFKRNV